MNQMAQIMCPHGGQVTIIPKPNKLMISGGYALLLGDLMGAPILGCTLPVTPAGQAPCLTVAVDPGTSWQSPKVKVMGIPALSHMGAPGGMAAGSPGGPLMCVFPGQTMCMG
jgi:hypothetical protein